MRIVKNVIKVECIQIVKVGALRVVEHEKVKMLDEYAHFDEIGIKVPGKCEWSYKMDNGQKVFTTNLQFESAKKLPSENLAFRFTTADGERYLVGTRQKPFPLAVASRTFPDSMTKSSLFVYKVTWEGENGALLII